MTFKTIAGLLYNSAPVGYDDGAVVVTQPPVVIVPPQVQVGPSTAFRQHAVPGVRTVSSIHIDPSNGWVVDFDVPMGYDHILRLVTAEASGGPGLKHVDILDDTGAVVASGDAQPGTVSIYVDTGNHGYGYPNIQQGKKYFMSLTVPVQNEYDLAFFDIQVAL